MRKRLRLATAVACGLLLLAAGLLFVIYWASQYVPAFYRNALVVDSALQEKASDAMLHQATAFASDLKKPGRWQAVFTAQQINGWLAVDLVRNHVESLPESVRDPRVAIESDRLVLASRLTWGRFSSVVTVTIEPYLPEAGVLALRIRRARAGLLPVPLRVVVDQISAAARQAEINLRWRQSSGDPVALISFAEPAVSQGKRVKIESLQLSDGEIYVASTTEQR